MEQLSGLDAMFIHAEMHGLPMHLSSFSIYDPLSAEDETVSFEDIQNIYQDFVVKRIPLLRCKLSEVPLKLDQPYWVEDEAFDLEYHLRHIALPRPGTWDALRTLLADLHSYPLNRDKPLWEAYLIDGLDNIPGVPENSFGFLLKVHHAVMDGRTGMNIFRSMHALSPFSEPMSLPDCEGNIDLDSDGEFKKPTKRQLMSRAWRNNTRKSYQLAKTLAKSLHQLGMIEGRKQQSEAYNLDKIAQIRFNGPISSRRVFDRIKVPLDDIQIIRKAVPGSTVNDVAMSVIGGAMRNYLLDKNELPRSTVIATIPIDIREEDDPKTRGNMVGAMNVAIRSDLADAVERLAAVKKESDSGKAFSQALGEHTIYDLLQNMHSGITAWGIPAAVNSGLVYRISPVNNTIISNVSGVPVPIYLAGAEMVESFGLGPLVMNTGLFHTVSSTCGTLIVSYVACSKMMPDPEFYAQCLEQAFWELRDEVFSKNLGSVEKVIVKEKGSVPSKQRKEEPAKEYLEIHSTTTTQKTKTADSAKDVA